MSNVTDMELIYTLVGNPAAELLQIADCNLNNLAKMSAVELSKVKGMTKKKVDILMATLEISRRRAREEKYKGDVIRCSESAYQIMYPLLADLRHEEVWAIYINRRGKVIKKAQLFKGGTGECTVDIVIALKGAIDCLASGMILVHNHPSGNIKPSNPDDKLTEKLYSACKTMEISLMDHIIVADGEYYSYADNGRLH